MVPCMLHCKSLVYVDEPLYFYVQRKSSISYVFKEEFFDTYKILIESLKKAAEDCGLSSQLEAELQGLYNVYGFTWATYIRNSSLKYREKKRNFEKLTRQKDYTDAVKRITKTEGAAAQIYKASIETKNLAVYLLGMKVHGFLHRVLRR